MHPPKGTSKEKVKAVKQQRAGFVAEGVPTFTPAPESLFKVQDDIPTLMTHIGTNTNPDLISLNPQTIQQRNYYVIRGDGVGFNETDFVTKPIDPMSSLAIVSTRLGTTFNPLQTDSLDLGSYVR